MVTTSQIRLSQMNLVMLSFPRYNNSKYQYLKRLQREEGGPKEERLVNYLITEFQIKLTSALKIKMFRFERCQSTKSIWEEPERGTFFGTTLRGVHNNQ